MALLTILITGGVMVSVNILTPAADIAYQFQKHDTATAEVYTLHVPADSNATVIPITVPATAFLSQFAHQKQYTVLAAINAGYFDPKNQQTASYIIQNGQVVGDPTQNKRIMDNPALQPYLPKMLNRSEFRVMNCHGKHQYEIARHQDPLPGSCQLIDSLQAGPNLFAPDAFESEGFIATQNGQVIRDPIGVNRLNARSAIGIDAHNGIILMMVAMKPLKIQPSGVSLMQLADLIRQQGAVKALALDGGSSSSLWVNGKTVYGKRDASDKIIERPVKSVLAVISR